MSAWLASVLFLRSTAVLVLAGACALALRRASAAARHAVWSFAAAALLALPLLAQLVPRWELAVLPARAVSPAAPLPTRAAPARGPTLDVLAGAAIAHQLDGPGSLPAADEGVRAAPPPRPLPPPRRHWSTWLVLLWALGVSAGLVQLLVGAWLVRRVASRAEPIEDPAWLALLAEASACLGIQRPVRLLGSASVAVPVVWGYVRAAVMLPPEAARWPAAQRRAFLLHELAHVKRRDCLTRTLANVARVLYWPQPLAWWALRQLRREAERACDDRVLASGTPGLDYAHHLLEAARGLGKAPRPLAVLAVAERSSLEDRLLALLDPGLRRGAATPRALVLGGLVSLLLVASAGALHPVARAVMAQAVLPKASPTASPSASALPAGAPAPATSPAAGAALAGTVKGPDGRPVDNALVLVWPEPFKPFDVPDGARTDGTGAFRLSPQGRAQTYRVRVEAAGLAPSLAQGLRPGAGLTFALQKGGVVEGTVYDGKSRQPIARARVEAREESTVLLLAPGEPDAGLVLATTDAKGRYRLEGLGPERLELHAAAPGYARAARQGARRGAQGVDFFLTPGSSISGVVSGPDRRPVAGARVLPISEMLTEMDGRLPSAASDEAGRFTVLGLEAGSYRLVVTAKGFAPAVVSGIGLDARSDRRVDVGLEAGVRVRGRLVDAERRPVAGSVRVQEVDGVDLPGLFSPWRADATVEGRFELEAVPPGSHALAVQPRGFPAKRVDVDVSGRQPVIDLGDVEMDAGLTLRGRVRERDGSPIAGAAVSASRASGVAASAETKPDGSFVLSGLAAERYTLQIEAEGFTPSDKWVAEPGEALLEVVLDKGGELTGIVVDGSGRPVARSSVKAAPLRPASDQPWRSSNGEAGADGRFRISSLAAGPYILGVDAAGHALKTVSNLAVKAGSVTDAGRIVLEAGGSVQGTVTDRQGRPVAGAEVWAGDPRRRGTLLFRDHRTTATDGAGRFALQGLPAGIAALWAAHPLHAVDSEPVVVTVEPGSEPPVARLVLSEGGRVAGIVRRRPLAPGERMFVQAVSGEYLSSEYWRPGLRPEGVVGEDGSFLLEHVLAGPARLMLVAGRRGRFDTLASKEVEVREGETASVEIALTDVRVEGRVRRGQEPVAGARLELRDEADGSMSIRMEPAMAAPPAGTERLTALTREDGGYELIVPVPGRYRVTLSAPGRRLSLPPRAREVQVPDAPSFRLDFDLPDSALAVTVVAADTGRPIPRARLAAVDPEGQLYRMQAGEEGRFDLNLSPASYTLRVEAPEYVAQETTLDVAAGENAPRTFHLARGETLKVRVVGPRGNPVRSALTVAASADGRVVRDARTSPEGTAEIGGLAAGEYTVFAASESIGFALQGGLAPGGPPATLTLARGAAVRLQLKDEGGAPLAQTPVVCELLRLDGAVVAVERLASYSRRLDTNDAGIVEVPLPLGEVALRLQDRDGKRVGALTLDTRTAPPQAGVTLRPPRPDP